MIKPHRGLIRLLTKLGIKAAQHYTMKSILRSQDFKSMQRVDLSKFKTAK